MHGLLNNDPHGIINYQFKFLLYASKLIEGCCVQQILGEFVHDEDPQIS